MQTNRNRIGQIRKSKLFSGQSKWEIICDILENQEQRLEQLEENVRNNNTLLSDIQCQIRDMNQEKRLKSLEENVRNNNAFLDKLQKNIEGNNEFIQRHSLAHQSLEENLRNNNTSIEGLQQETTKIEDLNKKINEISQYFVKLKCNLDVIAERLDRENRTKIELADSDNVEKKVIDSRTTENKYEDIDYFDFENHFRGSQESIKKTQVQYLKYFEGRHNVLDLGCGRGEFLELLKEHGIGAVGVDFYPEFVEYCKMHGLNVMCDDAIAYLERIETADGIFAGQLVEHLSSGKILALCRLAYEKLEVGSNLVIETPNPTSLAIFSHAFYIDPSHIKPVHPLTMKYYLEKAGFKTIEIIYTESSKLPVQIPRLQIMNGEEMEDFNCCMKEIEQVLFGSQDYAIVARK